MSCINNSGNINETFIIEPQQYDAFVTGFTLSSNTITLSQNRTDEYSAFTISLSAYTGTSAIGVYLPLSGGTVTGETSFISGLTASTISATTYQNLPKDVFVTGGTYSAAASTLIFTNNTGGTFNVSGITTSTQFTGGTVNGSTIFTNGLTANTISATTYFNLPIDPDIYVTGFTFDPNTYILNLKQNTTNSSYSAFTANLAILASDVTITGGTYNPNTGVATFTNNSGGTFNVSGFTSGLTDTVINSFRYIPSANTFTITDSRSSAFTATINSMSGLTVGGVISATTISATTFYGNGSNLTGINNIYNSDGTLTGNRVMGMSAYTLTLSGRTNISYSSSSFTDSPLVIKNTDPNAIISNIISFDCDATGVDQPVFMNFASTNPKGFGFYASNNPITATPDGAAFQMYNNASANFPGQIFFDSGANDNAAIIWRTAPTSGIITERMRVTSAGNVGIGTSTPKVLLQVGDGGGTMLYPYEQLVVEKNGDTKLSVYTSVLNSSDGGAAVVLGYSKLLTNDNLHPGFEFQHVGSTQSIQNCIRYNFIQRDSSGIVQDANSDLLNIYADGSVAINSPDVNSKLLIGGSNTVPSSKLEVHGDLSITSSYNLDFSNVTIGGSQNAFGLDYAIFSAKTTNTGIAITANAKGNPTGYGYSFQFKANQLANQLLFVGDNTTSAHYIHTDAFNGGSGWPLIFGVASSGQNWTVNSNLLVLTSGQTVGIGTRSPSNKLHVSASTDPVRFVGLASATDNRVLTVDLSGVVHTVALSAITGSSTSVSGAFLPLSGGTVSGETIFTSGLTANTISTTTISATTYQNVNAVTGGTYNSATGIITLSGTGSVNGNIITGFSTSVGGAFLPLSGGTVTGATFFTSALTVNLLTVTGNTILNNITGNTLNITGSTRLAGVTGNTLNVTGSATLSTLTASTLTLTSLTGSTDRIVQVNSGGTVSASVNIISAYISSASTAASQLSNGSNWDLYGVYTGTSITGTSMGQKHYDDNYFYEAVADNSFIRLIRG